VIGVDPVMTLLKLAPKSELVSYKRLRGGVIPLVTATVDVIWCCLVLGGMMDKDLRMASTEFERVLRPDGLLFLVENTSNKTSGERWTFRSVSDYCSLFPTIGLSHLHDYSDLGERISVISGRKHTQDSGR
jgi:SAM-dependent methyltransferase